MDANDIFSRLSRVFAGIQAASELDLSKLPLRALKPDGGEFCGFSRDSVLSDIERENCAIAAVLGLANIRDNACRWAKANGHDKQTPLDLVERSFHLKVINDLSNAEKHSYPPQAGKHSSGRAPKMRFRLRGMNLSTRPEKGSWVTVSLGKAGWEAHGDGDVSLEIDAVIEDKDGIHLGSLTEFLTEGFALWEAYFRSVGVEA
ncbi:MAG: hypothetical protein ICCCNLDF_02996 [Planctomycetes bacterium]|nr:hypothetical protein [Planctomycetota bacterium]